MTRVLAGLKRVKREVWLSVVSALFLIALWETAVDLERGSSPFIVAPSRILMSTMDSFVHGELLGHLSLTLTRMFAGFLAGTIAGLVVGLAMGWLRPLKSLLDPLVSVVYPLPKIALLPLIMLLVGIGELPIVLVISLTAFFPVLVNSIAGVANIDQIYFDVARNCGASRMKTFTKVVLPGALPLAFVGIRLALNLSLLVTVVVEMSIATRGLGAMLWLSWQTLRIEKIYVAIAVIAVLGLVLNPLLKPVRRYLIPWRAGQ